MPEPNRLYEGDIFELMRQIPDASVDMVFSDPDYNLGVNYHGVRYKMAFEAYRDWYIELARESLRVLKPDGNAFFINLPKPNAHLRAFYLDDAAYDVWEYAWCYHPNHGFSPRRFTTAHRTVLHVRLSPRNRWYKDAVAVPYISTNDKRVQQTVRERGYNGRMPFSWFVVHLVRWPSREKTIHPCQIPQALFRMLLRAATLLNDLVLVHFGGSGAELEVCQQERRHWLSAERHPLYADLIRKRLELGHIPDEYRYRPKTRGDRHP